MQTVGNFWQINVKLIAYFHYQLMSMNWLTQKICLVGTNAQHYWTCFLNHPVSKGCWKKNVPFWNTHSNSVNFQPTDFVQISMELSWKYGFNDVNKLFLRWLVQKLLRDMLETLEVWKWQLLYRVFHLNFHFFNF